jgi:RHS repeat-associated protein
MRFFKSKMTHRMKILSLPLPLKLVLMVIIILLSVPSLSAAQGFPGDTDHDNDADGMDLAALVLAFGSHDGDSNYNAAVDFISDGQVNESDLAFFSNYFGTVASDPDLPPDPAIVAPANDPSVATNLLESTEFLYTGPDPIQTGVDPGTIEVERAAVLRGRVLTRRGDLLTAVVISILEHPEFGQTLSRADGMFDMAVNGGGLLTVNYQKTGYLPAQRTMDVPWQDFTRLPDVVMIPLDAQVTAIDLTVAGMQSARGSQVNDADGTRQATLLFPQGTLADLVMPDGSTQSISNLSVRATEYTVGDNGPEAMPAELPPASAYTYAVEVSVDEAIAAGAKSVSFSKPLYYYVDNFIGLPTGTKIPAAYYDRDKAAWVPTNDGKVVEILAINGGMADLDTIGDGAIDNGSAIGVTAAERLELASLYGDGDTLWRVPLSHFSPVDLNLPFSSPSDAETPSNDVPENQDEDSPSKGCGFGSCDIENQVFKEYFGLSGSALNLHYSSDRAPGRQTYKSIRIPLSGPSIPASLIRIDLEIRIAGQIHELSFPPETGLSHTFTWDGLDAYGRVVQMGTVARINIGYVYRPVYTSPPDIDPSFGLAGDGSLSFDLSRDEIILWQRTKQNVTPPAEWFAKGQGIGGWTFNVHHAYDPSVQTLYMGDGTKVQANSQGDAIRRIAGTGTAGYGFYGEGGPARDAELVAPQGVATTSDGSVYFSDDNQIRKIDPFGIVTTIAGNGDWGSYGDGGPAIDAALSYPTGLDVGPDGGLYIAETNDCLIRKVDPAGIITTVAGMVGACGYGGDGGPATSAQISPNDVAVAPDGSIFIAEFGTNRVRYVSPAGIITTFAGNGNMSSSGDGGSATAAEINSPRGVALGPDGSVYIAEYGGSYIRRVAPDGIISTIAGLGGMDSSGDGGPSVSADILGPAGIEVGPDGTIYFTENFVYGDKKIRRISSDGIINTYVGGGFDDLIANDNALPTAIDFGWTELNAVALTPNGRLVLTNQGTATLHEVRPMFQAIGPSDITIPSGDGTLLHVFDPAGRHQETIHSLTGSTLWRFSYDTEGRLERIRDAHDNSTDIQRDVDGSPTSIDAPFGQVTILGLDPNDYLNQLTNPAGETVQLGYTADGLLETITDPKMQTDTITYDILGRVIKAEDPAGGFKELTRTELSRGYEVSVTSAMGRSSTFRVETLPTGNIRRTSIGADGLAAVTEIGLNGTNTTTTPDGTVMTSTMGPDPRFGMQAPIITRATSLTSGGITAEKTRTRIVNLSNPDDLLSVVDITDTSSHNGRMFTTEYDAATRTITTESAEGRQNIRQMDTFGRKINVQIGDRIPTVLTYNTIGLLDYASQGTGVDTRSIDYEYDTMGRVSSLTDGLGRVLSYQYDAADRIINRTLPGNRTQVFGYDANSNITSNTPPGQPAHEFSHTPVNGMASYTPPDIGSGATDTLYNVNLDRQLTLIARPDGNTTSFSYDSAGRIDVLTTPTRTVTNAYDSATGRVTAITTSDGIILSYTYDGGFQTEESWAGPITASVSNVFNNDGLISSQSVNTTPIAFTYDDDNRMLGAGDLAITRNTINSLVASTVLNNIMDGYVYNGFGELTDYSASYSTSGIFAIQYTYDTLGRITRIVETVDGLTDTYDYIYDAAGRLEEVEKNSTRISTYDYDDNGNRLSYTDEVGSVTVNGVYDDQDRLISYGTKTYSYTKNGELSTKTDSGNDTEYEYDVLGNLLNVTLPDGTSIDYVVDGLNRRIGKKINDTLVQGFLYMGQLHPVAELDGSNNIVSRFVYGKSSNVPEYMIKNSIKYRIISDHVGSPRLVVNSSNGSISQRMDYDEFGKVISDTNPGFQPFGYAGGLYDSDTGLVRFGARDYDAETGRWTAKDPLLFAASSNLYAYTTGDPINKIDPSGLNECSKEEEDEEEEEALSNEGNSLPEGSNVVGGGISEDELNKILKEGGGISLSTEDMLLNAEYGAKGAGDLPTHSGNLDYSELTHSYSQATDPVNNSNSFGAPEYSNGNSNPVVGLWAYDGENHTGVLAPIVENPQYLLVPLAPFTSAAYTGIVQAVLGSKLGIFGAILGGILLAQ